MNGYRRASGLVLSLFAASLGMAATGCSSDDSPPSQTSGAAGSGGTGGSTPTHCEPGSWRHEPNAECEPAGVAPSRCAEGFVADGKMGCEPVLPDAACPEGSIGILGEKKCHPVGVPEGQCVDGFLSDGKGACEPILPAAECPEGTIAIIGQTECEPVGGPAGGKPGVPSDGCAPGFVHDGEGGCTATLPSIPCASGQMAIPGETTCRPVMDCGTGTWGNIPIEANTEYVDGSYTGANGASDGSLNKPWVNIQDAIDAVSAGGMIAVAAGTYAEDLEIFHKKVRLWAKCPAEVSVVGSDAGLSTLNVYDADQSEIHGLAVTGQAQGAGIGIYGSSDVLLDKVWVHDFDGYGIFVRYDGAASNVLVQDSLVEQALYNGVAAYGGEATFRRTVIRDTREPDGGVGGNGANATFLADEGQPSAFTFESSVIQGNSRFGIVLFGATCTVDASVISDTNASAMDNQFGRGIDAEEDENTLTQSVLTLKRSQITRNHNANIFFGGATSMITDTTLEDAEKNPNDQFAMGVLARDDGHGSRANVTILRSTIRRSVGYGLYAGAADITVEDSQIQDTLPSSSPTAVSSGVSAQYQSELSDGGAKVILRRTTVERSSQTGVELQSASVTLDHVIVRDTLPNALSQLQGDGLVATHYDLLANLPDAHLTIDASLFENNLQTSMLITGTVADIQRSVFRQNSVQPGSMQGGFGIVAVENIQTPSPSSLSLKKSQISETLGAGLLIGGGNTVNLEGVVIRDTSSDPMTGTYGYGVYSYTGELNHRPSLTVNGLVLDGNQRAGAALYATDGELDGVVARHTRPTEDGFEGVGLLFGWDYGDDPSSHVTLRRSSISKNHTVGVNVFSSEVRIEDSIIVDNLPRESDGWGGVGVYVESVPDADARASLHVSRSHIARNQHFGVDVQVSDAAIDSSVLEDNVASTSFGGGLGLIVTNDEANLQSASATLSRSILQRNQYAGACSVGAKLTLQGVFIRDSKEDGSELGNGHGVYSTASINDTSIIPSSTEIYGSVIRNNRWANVMDFNSSMLIEDTVIEDGVASEVNTTPDASGVGLAAFFGRSELSPPPSIGVRGSMFRRNQLAGAFLAMSGTVEGSVFESGVPGAQLKTLGLGLDCETPYEDREPFHLVVRGVKAQKNHQVGINFARCSGQVEDTAVIETLPSEADAVYGDGISAENTEVTIAHSSVTGNARAGVSSFGAQISISSTQLSCNQLDLDAEILERDSYTQKPFSPPLEGSFSDGGENLCSCEDTAADCVVVSTNISPPGSLSPITSGGEPPTVQIDLSQLPPLKPF